MHGSKCFVIALICTLAACSSSSEKAATDCYDCVGQSESWQKFDAKSLIGAWKGKVETVFNEYSAKGKEHKDSAVEVDFLSTDQFLKSQKVSVCEGLPKDAVVINGSLWSDGKGDKKSKTFEVFGQLSEDNMSYGRAVVSQVNGEALCKFKRIGGPVAMNLQALPAVHVTERLTPDGRALASTDTTSEMELRFEFLSFKQDKVAAKNSRSPASVSPSASADNPPLMFRVFKIVNHVKGAYDQGQWVGTEEYIYRLWR